MKCTRCQGLMVRDRVYDPTAESLHIDIWRCLNCGEAIDDRILQARQSSRSFESLQSRRYAKRQIQQRVEALR